MRAYSEGVLSIPRQLRNGVFITSKDGEMTYDEFLCRVSKVINAIQHVISTRQNIVFLDTKNTVSFVVALFALNHLGQIAVPISSTYAPGELNILYNLYRPILTISDADVHTRASVMSNVRILHYSDFDSYQASKDLPVVDHQQEDICFILFTSGSEGQPKGAALTNYNVVADIIGIQDYMRLSSSDTCLITRSLAHASALVAELVLTSLTGGQCVLHENPTTIRSLFDHCEVQGVTWLGVPPALLRRIITYARNNNRQFSPNTVIVSGSILSASLCREFLNTFPETKLINAYGLTEASPRVAYLDASLASEKPGSVGYPINGCKVRVLKSNGIDCQELEVGEVYIAGENVMKGYFLSCGMQPFTNATYINTGDLGFLDEDGALYIVGRTDSRVIYNGINLYPEYIDAILGDNKCVQKVHTTLIHVDNNREKLIVFIEPNDGISEDSAIRSIRAQLSEHLDMRLHPDEIVVINAFPITASGKVDIQKLKSAYLHR